MGDSFDRRQANDAGVQMQSMASAIANLGRMVPSLAGPPSDGEPVTSLESRAAELITGVTLASLTRARTAVNKHWCGAMASGLDSIQDSVKRLEVFLTPSWKEHLDPSASWQSLVDSCSDTLGMSDVEAIMACLNQAKKVRLGIS